MKKFPRRLFKGRCTLEVSSALYHSYRDFIFKIMLLTFNNQNKASYFLLIL